MDSNYIPIIINKNKIIFSTIAFIFYLNAYAQTEKIEFGEKHIINSSILKEEREIRIFVPNNNQNGNEKYQVLYLLDAEWHFHFISALVDKLIATGDMPKTIIVGVVNNNRNKDLTPAGTNDNPQRFGGAEKFLDFITDELQPWVKKNYNTHPYNILAGHSFGGLFAVYSMMKKPNAFQSYIVLSPSLGRNNEQQIRTAEKFFDAENHMPKDVYIAVGNEGGFTFLSTQKFVDILDKKSTHKFRYTFEHLPIENHASITAQGYMNGLKFIYEGFNPEKLPMLDDIFLIEKHYKDLSEKYGHEFKIPEEYFQKFIKEQIGERELDYALFILGKYKDNYPQSIYVLQFFADINLLQGNFDEAKKYYLQLDKAGVESDELKAILKSLED